METRCFPSAINLIHTHQRYLHFHTRSGEGRSGRGTGRGSLCAALRRGLCLLPGRRENTGGQGHGSPHGTGAVPSTLLVVAGWVGALRGKGCPGGLHRVWRGAGGAMGMDGPVRGEQGAVGHGGALQEGIQLPREPVAARTMPSPGAGAGQGVSSPPAAARSLCPDARCRPMKEGRERWPAQHHPVVSEGQQQQQATAEADFPVQERGTHPGFSHQC